MHLGAGALTLESASRPRSSLALALMLASGFAGLGYQIVWAQQASTWLGHEAAAVLAVVTAFFGGVAIGASWLGGVIARSSRPERWYAACELIIASWSLILTVLMAPVGNVLLQTIGVQPSPMSQWAIGFGGVFLLLLPATAAMGATLPAMERVNARLGEAGQSVALLYAVNTFGAVGGVLAAAFWLVPEMGLTNTAMVCAGLNIVCALGALRLTGDAAAVPGKPSSRRHPRLLATFAMTGLLGIGYEVLVVRVLSQLNEDTVYTFAILLAVYLVGTASGAATFQRLRTSGAPMVASTDRLLAMLAGSCLFGALALHASPQLKDVLLDRLGTGMGSALATETMLAVAAFALPTFMMGMVFSALSIQAREAGLSFSKALGANTLGAAAAPVLFGVLITPLLGPHMAFVLIALGYLALTAPRMWLRLPVASTAAAAVAIAGGVPALVFVDVPDGGHIVSYREGSLAAVSVVEDAAGVLRLRIDNRQQEGSSASLLADARQALLPLLLHPSPTRALFLGLGTGVTARSAAEDPALDVDAVELLPEVIAASEHFKRPSAQNGVRTDLHIIAADARRFVRASTARYDVIVSDNFHPARSGSGSLYTVEHFQAVRERLAEGGLFCQWLPLHQLDLPTLRSIVRSFLAVNPGAWALLATNSLDTPVLGLVARKDVARFDLAQVKARLATNTFPQDLADFGIQDDLALLGGFVAGPDSLARFAADAPLNTDDHPVVAYLAPRVTYTNDSLPRERLLDLLAQVQLEPEEVTGQASGDTWRERLTSYWAARDEFIKAGRQVVAAPDVKSMLTQVQEPLLAVLRTSPDFRPAYDPLLRMAASLARDDVPAARVLLRRLALAAPARQEALQLLQTLDRDVAAGR